MAIATLSSMALAAAPSGCDSDRKPVFAAGPAHRDGNTFIQQPYKLSGLETNRTGSTGAPVRIACASCHSLRASSPLPDDPQALKTVHSGLRFEHGDLRCRSCHQSGRSELLHLATGEELPLEEAIRLCAQCHGPQWRDYRHGSHGGMNGYWDSSRGPKIRNHCIDCHEPHAPRYPGARPVFAPRDRIPPNPAEAQHG